MAPHRIRRGLTWLVLWMACAAGVVTMKSLRERDEAADLRYGMELFESGVERSRAIKEGLPLPSWPALQSPDPTFLRAKRINRLTLNIAGWSWAVIWITTVPFMNSRYFPALARLGLAAAIVFTAAAEASTIPWFTDNYETLWLAGVMLGLSSVYLGCAWLDERFARQRQVIDRICLTCGYDLRASRERCPECGTPVPSSSSRAAHAQQS